MKLKAVILAVLAAVIFPSVPCCAQQAQTEQLKATATSLPAESANHAASKGMPQGGSVTVEFFSKDGGFSQGGKVQWNVYFAIVRQGATRFQTVCVYEWSDNGWNTSHKLAPCAELAVGKTYDAHEIKAPDPVAYPEMPDKSLGTLFIAHSSYLVAKGDLAQAVLDDAEAEVEKVARQKALRSLGLHQNQSQSQVKILLQKQGFEPWRCDSILRGNGTYCVTTRRRGKSAKDELDLNFRNVTRRDQDTGLIYVVSRVLWTAEFSGEEVGEVTAGPEPF